MAYDPEDHGEFRVHTVEHLHGRLIVEHGYPAEYRSFLGVLDTLALPLRRANEFIRSSRPSVPKRQKKRISGRNIHVMMPVDQGLLNTRIHDAMRAEGWLSQPLVDARRNEPHPSMSLRGDFARSGVFVEVEFGNTASMYRDLFKFQVASRSGAGQVAILVVALDRFARTFDSGVATFETAEVLLPYMAIGTQMPIWVVGIEPLHFEEIERRYGEMQRLCEANGVECHDFATAQGGQYDPGDEDD